jgi:hypothetical protein
MHRQRTWHTSRSYTHCTTYILNRAELLVSSSITLHHCSCSALTLPHCTALHCTELHCGVQGSCLCYWPTQPNQGMPGLPALLSKSASSTVGCIKPGMRHGNKVNIGSSSIHSIPKSKNCELRLLSTAATLPGVRV